MSFVGRDLYLYEQMYGRYIDFYDRYIYDRFMVDILIYMKKQDVKWFSCWLSEIILFCFKLTFWKLTNQIFPAFFSTTSPFGPNLPLVHHHKIWEVRLKLMLRKSLEFTLIWKHQSSKKYCHHILKETLSVLIFFQHL